jgi:Zn-dependent protease
VFGRSIQLGRVFGIRIGVDPSWFLVLFLVIYSLTGYYQDVMTGGGDTGPFVLATVSALLFFLSILLHELGHALVAIRHGIGIVGIDLFLFGGIAKMERDSDSPAVEFKIAAAGPAVTLLIAVFCMVLGFLVAGTSDFWAGVRFASGDLSDSLLAVLGYLAFVNVVLLAFNLIPAFPLDGGRIARAFLWWRTGDRNRATGIAARVGGAFSYGLILVGVAIFVYTGDIILGVWFVFIGLFLGQAARGAAYQTAVLSKIQGVRVADVMDSEPVAISAELPVTRALEEYFLRYGWPWFPVVDEGSRFIGVVERQRAEGIPEERQPVFTVREIMLPDEQGFRVRTDDPLEALLGREPLHRIGALMAVDRDGRLRGVVTLDQIRRALQHGVAAR